MKRPRQRTARKNKYDKDLYPQGIIDVIKIDYPDRCSDLPENLETLFSEEEWIDILTKSRLSYKNFIKMKKLRIKNQNN